MRCADAKLKLQIANELRDSIDLFTHTVPADYTKFLGQLMPVFLEILRGPPVFVSTSPEQVSHCAGRTLYRAEADEIARNYGV